MASMAQMNPTKLSEMLGREIADAPVLIAKNLILGNQKDAIAGLMGVEVREIEEICETQDFKDVHLILAAHHNSNALSVDFTYDDIEQAAIQKLAVRVDRETDVDKLIRIATMANRATRRTAPKQDSILDPARANGEIKLNLSQRMIDRLSGRETERTAQISIKGPHVQPTFKDLESALGGIKAGPRALDRMPQSDSSKEVTFEALMRELGTDE